MFPLGPHTEPFTTTYSPPVFVSPGLAQSGKYQVSHSHSKFHRQVRIPVDAKKNFFLLSFFSKSQRVTQRLRLKVTLRHLEKTKMAVLEKKPSRSKMAAFEKKPSRSKMAANLNKKLHQKKNQNPKNPTWRTLGFKTKRNLGLGVPPTRFAGPKIPHLICIKFPELGRHILYLPQDNASVIANSC